MTRRTQQHQQQESIYDYLDALETESQKQLRSTNSAMSLGSRSAAGSVRGMELRDDSKQTPLSHSPRDFAWESESSHELDALDPRSFSGSPAPSYRSGASRIESDANSHQYYVGIKEKVATMTIELNVRVHVRAIETARTAVCFLMCFN